MYISPTNFKNKITRKIIRIHRRFDLYGAFLALAAFFGAIGAFTNTLKLEENIGLYFCFALAILFHAYYMKEYYRLRFSKKARLESYEEVHKICEKIRELSVSIFERIKRGESIGDKEWQKEFRERCERAFIDMSEKLTTLFQHLGYNVESTTIKIRYNRQLENPQDCIIVVGRSSERKEQEEDLQAYEDALFFQLLMKAHEKHSDIKGQKEARVFRINRVKTPKYLAIDQIHKVSSQMKILDFMLNEQNDQKREIEHWSKLSRLAGTKYSSCLGIGIKRGTNDRHTAKMEREEQMDIIDHNIQGFIGLDSHDENCWRYLEPKDIELLAGIADLLYIPCVLLSIATKETEQKEIRY